ncbi:hypothetical protein [Niabella beijingensis]|uniref:hypothetical protein n=1 Tax=Niabella beijingensis TaxID=2872700 RepID=UPI001CBD71AA|nr:hypothetical protein [Niabella beijingensis]MBZ4188354.1 hypothetical protein [Niabella beijingensis]
MQLIKVLVILLILLPAGAFAQEGRPEKGAAVYVVSNKDAHANDVKKELEHQLKEWGYWTIAGSKKNTAGTLRLQVQTHRGMTAWSWGGVTVRASVALEDAAGEVLWTSKEYKANPNGTNGFNTARATVEKIIREMQRSFR